MATVQQQPRPSLPTKHETFVEEQLRRALGRIRMFDTAAALLGLFIGTVAYGLGMMLLDRYLDLPSQTRQFGFFGYVLLAFVYLAFAVGRPMLRRVNPYYAAKQVEQTVPGAKNSVVNWLDLRDQKLPAAIRNAVGMRAAKDLGAADLDRAISGRHVFWLGGIALFLFAAFIALLAVLGPSQFFSLFGRAFKPFVEGTIATRTRLTIVEPRGSDAVVAVSQPVTFTVRIEGRVPDPNKPDALRLLFRYNQAEPVYLEKRLERGDNENEWTYRLPGFEVQNGFWYKIAGGDFETDEHRVQVRSNPLITGFEVRYKYRPYLIRTDQLSKDANLEALRGTEVTLLARTNRKPQAGSLQIEGEPKPVKATITADSGDALQFKLVLERDGIYRIRFTSSEDEASGDSMPYAIKVHPDLPPKVELTTPGKDVVLPANGVLSLTGSAMDDFGVKSMALRMRVKGLTDLAPKVYRQDEGKDFKFTDGSYPLAIQYQDFVELDKVKDAQGRAIVLDPGMEVEYWLEATDNCDYPAPNVGRTEKTYKIKIAASEKDPKKAQEDKKKTQEDKKKAEKDKKDQAKKQDEQQAKEDKAKQDQAKNESNPNSNQGEQPKNGEDKKRDDVAQKLKDEQNKGDAKPQKDPEKGGSKDQGQNQQDNKGAGENKPQPKDGQGQQAGENKGEGKQGDKPTPQADKGQGKPEPKPGGNPEQGQKDQGDSKPQPKEGQGQQAGENKGDKEGTKSAGGEKGQGGQNGGKQAGQGKNEGKNAQAGTGSPKGNGQAGKPDNNQQATGAAKDDPSNQAKGEPKPGAVGDSKQQPQGIAKGNDANGKGQQGQPKPNKGEQANAAGAGKGEPPPKKEPTGDDVAQAADTAKNGDGPKKDEAVRQLQDMARNAKDPQVRKEAKDALEKNGQPMTAGDNSTDPKDPAGQGAAKAGSGKAAPPDQASGEGKVAGKGKPNERGAPKEPGPKGAKTDPREQGEGKPAEGKSEAGAPKEAGPGPNGTATPSQGTPGGPGDGTNAGERKDPLAGPDDLDGAGGSAADMRHKLKAGELQLEEFKKRVTPDMLKKLDMSKEEWAKFLKDYEGRLAQLRSQAQEQEKLERASGGTRPNPGAVRTRPTTGNRDPLQGVGPLLPPSEFQKSYPDFTQELSKLKPQREK